MKKFLKIFLIVIASLFIILLLAPIFFKKPIENLVKKQINNSLNAKVEFTDFKLSFIRAFPNVYVGLDSLSVVGTGEFEKDTLIAFKRFSVNVDILSAIKMKNIKVKSILLDSPHITALVLKNGKANWDIVKDTTTTPKTPEDTIASEPIDLGANLQKFEIKHAYVRYQDDTSKISANIKDFNFFLAGDFSAKTTDMKIETSIESIDVVMGGIKYLKQAKFSFIAQLGADLEKAIYTIKNNEIKLNELSLSLEGAVKMPTDSTFDVDMKFNTNKADFKTLLSLIPAIYMKDFEKVQTSGKLQLSGFAKGLYDGKVTPNAGLNLKVENAMFKYPDLPKSVNNINIDVNVLYNGTDMDKTTVDVNKFHVEMAGNPFDVKLHIKTPMSDMGISGIFAGKLDFNSIADIVPMDSMTLKGLLSCNIDMDGHMSSIEKEKYEEFKADGTLSLQNFEFVSPDFKQGVKIVKTDMKFSPKYVELTDFDARVGKSDFQMSGKLEKFIPYIFANDTIVGALNFSSTLTDVNELMGPSSSETTTTAPEDTTPLSVIEVPGNIDFNLNAKIGQINYDKIKITNLAGIILVKNSKAILKKLGMNLLDGSMILDGEYNTQNVKKPSFAFNFDMKNIDIPSTYTAFNTVQKMAPAAKNCKGKISAQLNINSVLDEHMNPVYNTMQGYGKLATNSVEISDSKTFNKIADVLKNDKYRKLSLTNLNISIEIKDGRIYVKPFDTKVGNTKLNISGDQGIDQTINYVIKTAIPRADLGGAANSIISAFEAQAAAKGVSAKVGETVNVNLGVTGTFADPQVKLLAGDKNEETPSVKEQAKAAVEQKVAEVKEDVKKKAKEQADKLIKDAEVEAQKIRDAAKAAANAARTESNAGADRLIKEAGSNPLKKEAAKKAAEKLRKEGESKAQKIEQEGNSKADALINKAKAEAAKLE
jgi:hypothetical protein